MLFKHTAFGLDISDHSVKAVALENAHHPTLTAMAYRELPGGILAHGAILNLPELTRILRDFLAHHTLFGAFPSRQAIVSLPESQTYLHYFTVPASLPADEALAYLEKEASALIPLAPAERISDYHIIAEGAQSREAVFATAPRALLSQWHAVISGSGLEPVIFEPELVSLARSIAPSYNGTNSFLLIDIGAHSTDIAVVQQGRPRLTASFPMGGEGWAQTVAEKLGVPFEKARALTHTQGIGPDADNRIREVLIEDIGRLAKEIKAFHSFAASRRIHADRALVTGGASLLPGIYAYLSGMLQIEVLPGDPWTSVDISGMLARKDAPHLFQTDPVLYATCIGAALRALAANPAIEHVNLLTHFEKKGRFSGIISRLFHSTS